MFWVGTAGQERYHSLAPMYYRGAQAAIVVYDITVPETFGRAKSWVKELQRQASPNIVIALVGNKLDLDQKRAVTTEDAQTYSDDNNLLFMETSAKSGVNVNEVFVAIAHKLPKSEAPKPKPEVDLKNNEDPNKKKPCCGGQ